MEKLVSHTIVRNGKPFLGLVIEQVIPFVNVCFITVSKKADRWTLNKVQALATKYPSKITLFWEDVKDKGQLTQERQKQLDYTDNGSWVLFLDDDDYWSANSLNQIQMFLSNDVDGLAVNPYQLIDDKYYDSSWHNKWFTKLFKKVDGVHYEHPWPKDLIYKKDELLYWKTNIRVPRIPIRFFHLSYLKNNSFRNQKGFEKFKMNIGARSLIPKTEKEEIEKIWKIYKNKE